MKDRIIDSIGKIDDDMIESVDALRQSPKKRPQKNNHIMVCRRTYSMKIKHIRIICAVLIIGTLASGIVFAVKSNINVSAKTVFPETNGVYATVEEQEQIMKLIMEDDNFVKFLTNHNVTIDQASIMPLYSMGVVEYFQSDILNINRSGNTYFADCLDQNGNYAGNLIFSANKESVSWNSFGPVYANIDDAEPDLGERVNAQSLNYRNYEEFIKENIGEDVSEKDVILATGEIRGLLGFFVKGNKNREDIFVNIPTTGYGNCQIIPVSTGLKELGQKEYKNQQDYLAEKEQWEKEHPGETYMAVGGSGLDSYRSEKGLSPLAVMLISAAGVVLLAAVTVTVVVIRKKKQIQTA